MGTEQSTTRRVNFEDIKKSKQNGYVLINTLPSNQQTCLIKNTVPSDKEVQVVEKAIKENIVIIIYGYNSNDPAIYKKYNQLVGLGHTKTFLYCGGLFEWLLLQDIYGKDEFNTTINQLDILKYKPDSDLNKLLIKN